MSKKSEIHHIDYAIIAQAHTPMYLIHKYWARKPHNVVSQYIQRYSKEGEIVLDPFGGSGVTAMEAIKAGRKAISIDLNPMSAFLIENTLSPVGTQEIEEEFRRIQRKLKDNINRLYETKCPKCKQKAIVLATVWEKGKKKPQELRCACPVCKKYATGPRHGDLALLNEIEELKPKKHPRNRLAYDGNLFKEGTHLPEYETIDSLFTKRNLYALSLLFDEEDVTSTLEEYAVKTPDGNWMLKPGLKEDQRESIHNLMIFHLAKLGKKAGFKVWIGSQEQKFQVKNKPLAELCDRIPVLRHVPQDSVSLDRIRRIDVLWLEYDRIRYEFEVENTTGISEAIIRGSNIPEGLNPKRFIVIPEARERFLFRKLQEPILAEAVRKAKWNFIRHADLEKVAKAAGKTFDPSDLEAVAKMPKDSGEEKQLFLL